MSPIGLVCSIAGGLAVGVAFYVGIILSAKVENSPNQIHLVWLGAAAGLIGSIIDSVLGATLQVGKSYTCVHFLLVVLSSLLCTGLN